MGPKFNPRDLLKLVTNQGQDFDLQAGAHGMNPAQAAARYLRSPGHFLALLRFFRGGAVDHVADVTGIPAKVLTAYEKGERQPSLKDLAALATHYQANLRVLLEVFGHVAAGASEVSMGIAAQFAGALSEDEKVNLQEVVKHYSARSKKKKRGKDK